VWREEKTADLARAVRDGSLDAALLALEADIGDVEREVIARDPFVLAAPSRHPLGMAAAPARPAELRDAPVLLLDDGHCFRDQTLAVCSRARMREGEFRATRVGLRVRPFAEPVPHRTIGLVWRRSSPLAPALRQVAATIREAYPRK
jgi:LysR family hydrogen peroxide-inducible transcriptional activator